MIDYSHYWFELTIIHVSQKSVGLKKESDRDKAIDLGTITTHMANCEWSHMLLSQTALEN